MKQEEKSRRIRERLGLRIPLRVRGRDSVDHEWSEVSRLLDVTPFGARFGLSRPTEPGRLLHATLAMPRALRCFDHVEDQYRVWCLVRNVKLVTPSEKSRAIIEVGVAFFGKRAPQSYEADPTRRYQISSTQEKSGLWAVREDTEADTADKRQDTRHTIPVEVMIEVFGEEDPPLRESTVTENISRGGATVFTSLNIEPGRFIKMISQHHNTAVLAAVRKRRSGPDGIPRLHLEFVGGEWPLVGVE
jgi:PilZ domain-containing protein